MPDPAPLPAESKSPSAHTSRARSGGRVLRWLIAAIGVMSVAMGAVGVVVPGLPTTVFLLFAMWCFARSCPWLEDRLLRNRFFLPYLRLMEGSEPLSPRARTALVAVMWVFVLAGVASLHVREAGPVWLRLMILGGAMAGTVAIVQWRRGGRRPDAADGA